MKSKSMLKSSVAAILSIPALAFANGTLENPIPNEIQSGVSIVSGWHCTASEVEIFIDGESIGGTGVGSVRNDTTTVCGHNLSGYALLYNYNILEDGEHLIEAYADGTLLEKRTFTTLRSGGVPFLEGKSATTTVIDFPNQGDTTTLGWSQAKQSFVVIDRVIKNNEPTPGGDVIPEPTEADIEIMYEIAIEEVKRRLRAPSTMQIVKGPTFEPTVPGRGGVEFEFDAQNAFGAMIRNRATCGMEYKEGTWQLYFLGCFIR